MPLSAFRWQLEWLRTRYEVIPLPELVQRWRTARSLRGLAALTFDDGYNGVLRYAVPEMRQHGLPFTLFLVGEPPSQFWWDHSVIVAKGGPEARDRWLRSLRGVGNEILQAERCRPETIPSDYQPACWTELVASLGPDLTIGAHSRSHPALPYLTPERRKAEVVETTELISEHVGTRPRLFAYPYGLWDRETVRTLREAGYEAALTLEPRLLSIADDPHCMPRIGIPSTLPPETLELWAAGLIPGRLRYMPRFSAR